MCEYWNLFLELCNNLSYVCKYICFEFLIQYHLIGGYGLEISEHELRTIVRVNGNRLPYFNYEKLIEQIITPTDEFK